MATINATGVLAVVGVGLVGFLAWRAYKALPAVAGAVGDAAHAVSPLNNDNVFARAANGVGAAVSGDSDWTLGGWIYDLTHDDYDPNVTMRPPSQSNYQAPAIVSNAQPTYMDQPSLSFSQQGASFKDLAAVDAVNPFAYSYGN